MPIPTIVYVTTSAFKIEECTLFQRRCTLGDADHTPISDCVNFSFRQLEVLQVLDVDINTMVRIGVAKAYEQVRAPCIVEYAGLIFERHLKASYPGGLTKAMWKALYPEFLSETGAGGQKAIARAVVAYCDGKDVMSFVGETHGRLAEKPRGNRKFYWDTVFIPDIDGAPGEKTYAELVARKRDGLFYKMESLSQSATALRGLVRHLQSHPRSDLWRIG